MAKHILHQPGNGRVLRVGEDCATVILESSATAGAFALVEYRVAPGSGPGQHTHDNSHETYWVIEGEVVFLLGRERCVLQPGGLLHVPPGVVHGFRNESETPARLLWLFTPGLALERMGWSEL